MNKKFIISALTCASLFSVMPACTNLDEEVYDKLPAEEFGKTETQVNALIGTVYKTLKVYMAGGNFLALDEMAGSSAVTPTRYGGDWYDGGQYREIHMHTYTAQTSAIKSAWSNASEAIGTCNANMQVVQNATVLKDAEKQQAVAEIRGVRAFWIYKMMDEWGNVPLVTDYDDKELPTCQSRQTVFDWLIKEVNEIAEQCPDRAGNYAKFTKGAAYTLLAKLYLNAEAWGVTCSDPYTKVIECCNKVMAMGYILEPNWKDNFSLTNENSGEAILSAPYSKTDTSKDNRNQLMNRTLHYKDYLALGNTASSTWNGVCAQPDYVKQFDVEDPRYEGTYLIGMMYDKTTGQPVITDHGYELNHTIEVTMIPGTEYDGTTWGAVNQHDGARCIKWTFADDLVDAMENDFHIWRYADILLMKAEALLRSGGSTADATDLVNQVRSRAYGDSNHNYSTVTLKEIQLERRFEFAWELQSRQDDIRFGCYDKDMWSSSGCPRKTDNYLKLFPISQDAWQTNSNLTQNPGYASF